MNRCSVSNYKKLFIRSKYYIFSGK